MSYDVAMLFMCFVYFIMSLQWGLWKAHEAKILYSKGLFFRIFITVIHTILAPFSIVFNLFKGA
jgi:hypothetical protein